MDRFTGSLSLAIQHTKQLHVAAEANDQERLSQAGQALAADWNQTHALATELGLSDCLFLR
jgi:hypothetical protein